MKCHETNEFEQNFGTNSVRKFYLKYHEMHAYLLSVLSFKRYKIDTIFNVLIAVCCLSTFVFDKLSFIVSSFHLNNYSFFVCKCYALNKMMCISVLH